MPVLTVEQAASGLRLDRYLRRVLPQMPTGHIFKLLRTKKVRLNGKRARAEDRVQAGDQVLVHMSAERFEADRERRPVRRTNRIDFGVVFEDEHLLVVSKPPFLPVHPGAGHEGDSLIDQVHTYLEVEQSQSAFRPSLAHRLDRDTSGLVMVGKDPETLRALAVMLKEGAVAKRYLALARGRPEPPKGLWELEVLRRDIPGAARAPDREPTKPGRTAYRVAISRTLGTGRDALEFSLLVLRLLTGRTHQIRSHLLQVGHPLAGDRRYGDPELNRLLKRRFGLERQFLHAFRLKLRHPTTGRELDLSCPYPPDLEPIVRELRLGIPAY